MAASNWLLELNQGPVSPAKPLARMSSLSLVYERSTGIVSQEYIPNTISLALRMMYRNKMLKLFLRHNSAFLTRLSHRMGNRYDSPESVKFIAGFIKQYNLDTSDVLLPLSEFKSFNEFFSRELKPESRPIAALSDDTVAVSAADCRLIVFTTAHFATRLWIKGKLFSIPSMLNNDSDAELFDGGSLAVFRLAPQDYHRYHFPVSGRITRVVDVPGKLYTVNPIAVHAQDFNVFSENKRVLVFIESDFFGTVCLVIVGATVVGSIVIFVKEGAVVKKGDPCGLFAYGGSTVVALFQKGAIMFDEDLAERSHQPMETLIKMGDTIGCVPSRPHST